MLNIRHVLFATDFSASARAAAEHAILLAQHHEADLHVLHVLPLSSEASSLLEGYDHLADSINVPDTLHVTQTQVKNASAAEGILEYARAQQIDLVVLGTRGQSGLRRVVMGSVAEAVVRQAECPVLTVREPEHARSGRAAEGEEKPKKVEHILAPVDFSRASRRSLLYARNLAAIYEAHIDLIHVILPSDPEAGSAEDVVYGAAQEEPVPRREHAKRRLAAMARGARLEAPALHVVYGHLHEGILDFAREQDSDLVVIGTHGRSGLERVVLGSVAEQVIRQAPCPVFTVRSFGKSLVKDEAGPKPDDALQREEA